MCLVSIRCLVYNHEAYLRQCLDGFVMQKTNFRFEAIVHDDASTDGSAAIIREYAEKYPYIIKPIFETENQYSKRDGSLRRIMDEACKGKYIAMCEGDDYWTDPFKLQKQVDFLESHSEYGLCYAKARSYDQRAGRFKGEIGSYCAGFVEFLEAKASIPALTVMYRAEYLKGYSDFVDGKRWLMGDAPLWLYIAYNSKIYFLDEVVAVYRVLENSATGRNSYSKRKEFIRSSYDMRLFFANKCNYRNVGYLEDREALSLFNNAVLYGNKGDSLMYFKNIRRKTWKVCIKYALVKLNLSSLISRKK